MTDKTITLHIRLVERLERLAQAQGRTLDEVFGELLEPHTPPGSGNWALAVAEAMEAADIDWRDEPEASTHSRAFFEQHLREQRRRSQPADAESWRTCSMMPAIGWRWVTRATRTLLPPNQSLRNMRLDC